MTNFTPITNGMTGSAATFNSRFQELSDAIDTTALAGAAQQVIVDWTELLSDAASIYLSSIPQTFKHLLLNIALGTDGSNPDGIILTINESGNADYYWQSTNVNTALAATTGVTDTSCHLVRTASSNLVLTSFSPGYIFFPNYTSTAENKTYFFDVFNGNSYTSALMYRSYGGGVWAPVSPAAITAVRLQPLLGANWRTGSSYQLIGIE